MATDPTIVLTGADLALPDELVAAGAVHLVGDRIAAVERAATAVPAGATTVDCSGCLIVPGFVDVHVHGVEGVDVLDDADAVARVAATLPKYGVTAFCPTSVACTPADLAMLLRGVQTAPGQPVGARVLGAHLESNFINPEYRGAQPIECLRRPPGERAIDHVQNGDDDFTGDDVLDAIATHASSVAIVTIAPEIDGGLDLVRQLVADGHRVSIGHSGATYQQALAAIAAGVRHATHLFNRMSPLGHRAPGVPGAVLESHEVAAEIICDGFHVHPALVRLAVAAKGVDRIMAITDGTAGSGLPPGTHTRLGRSSILVTARAAELADGTLAGSVLTMDEAFRRLVTEVGLSPVQAARACATTPARELGLADSGAIVVGGVADLVVLGPDRRVRRTYVAGRAVFVAD